MAAKDSVSPVQFGFKPHRESIARDVDNRMVRENFQSKRINLARTTFRATQTDMSPRTVFDYQYKPSGSANKDRWGHSPEVIKRGDEHVVWNGHHRIAAAKQRGQKTMTVRYQDTTGKPRHDDWKF